jgi:hypothetical protein
MTKQNAGAWLAAMVITAFLFTLGVTLWQYAISKDVIYALGLGMICSAVCFAICFIAYVLIQEGSV